MIHSSSCTTLEMKLEKFDHCHTQEVMVMLHQIEMLKTLLKKHNQTEKLKTLQRRWW